MKLITRNRQVHILKYISDWLMRMCVEIDFSIKKQQTSDIPVFISILKDIINLVYMWDLVCETRISEEQEKLSDYSLADLKRRILVHITTLNDVSAIRSVLDQFSREHLERKYERLIILILSDNKISPSMKAIRYAVPNEYFSFDGLCDIWNIPCLIKEMKGLDIFSLEEIAACVEELKIVRECPSNPLPSVPKASASFVHGSRDGELLALIQLLESSNVIYLYGIAGIGKTELAIQLANKYEPLRGAYFLRYQRPLDNAKEAMRETILAADFDGYQFVGEDSADHEQEYQERLKIIRNQYQGALLIIDGFDWPGKTLTELREERSFQDLITTGITLVFTTRNKVKKASYKVGPLCEEAVLKLMYSQLKKGYSDRVFPNEQLLNLAKVLECHTMGIELITKALNGRPYGLCPKKMMEFIQQGRLDDVYVPTTKWSENGISNCISLMSGIQQIVGYSLLSEQNKTVLHCIALFPNGINIRIFRKVVQQELWKDVSLLAKQNMVSLDRDLISIPAVIRVACQVQHEDIDRYCSPFLERLWMDYSLETKDTALALQMANGYAMAAIVAPDNNQYLTRAARLYELTGRFQDALSCMEKNVLYLERIDSSDQLSIAVANTEIGRLCSVLGKASQSLKHRLKALRILENILPANSPDLGMAYFDIGLTYQKLEKHTEELEAFQKAYAVFSQSLSEDHPDLARSSKYISKAFLRRKHASIRRRTGDQNKSSKG